VKVYDIILAFIRALVVLDLIRELTNFVYLGVRFSTVIGVSHYAVTRVTEATNFISPVLGMIMSLVIFAASRPIAEFSSKFATAENH
jgi:hypothetical protein